jgi:hypothetical protein
LGRRGGHPTCWTNVRRYTRIAPKLLSTICEFVCWLDG